MTNIATMTRQSKICVDAPGNRYGVALLQQYSMDRCSVGRTHVPMGEETINEHADTMPELNAGDDVGRLD